LKRIFLIIGFLTGVGIATAAYLQFGGSPEANRDLYLKKARQYISQARVKQAVIEFRNAVKADPTSGESHHELGLALLKLGDHENASREFMRASNLKPDMMQPRYQLANLYLRDRDVRRAKEQLNEIQQHDPDSVEVRQIVAKIALVEKDPDRAVTELTEALKKEPNRVSLYVDIASIYSGKKDFKRAEEFYRRALEFDPKLIEARVALPRLYLAMGGQAKAEQELILATEGDPENENLLHIRASEYAETQKFDEFEKLYLDLLKKKPDSLMAKKRLAEFYILKGDLQKGWAYTHEIEKARPGDPDAIYFYGRLHLAQKEWARAEELLLLAIRGAPSFVFAHYFVGQARLGNNDIAQAKTAFAKAKELNPVWLEPRLALARMYLDRGAYDLALEESEPMLQAQPRNVDILMIAGTARLKKGEAGPALELFRRAKEVNPTDATPHIHMGAAYALQKKYGQALTAYEEALKLDPDRIDALGSIAQVLAVQGNQKTGFERVQQQLAKTKNKAEVYELLGQLSMDQQDYEKAISYLGKAVALKPDLFSAAHLIASTYLAQKKFDQAIAESEKIIQKNPRATQSYMLLGILHDLKQQYDQANRYYKKVLDLDKNSALAANNLAWNYTQYGGNVDVALTLAQKARELNPNDEGIAHTLGWIYYKKGVYLKAINFLKESSEKLKDRNPTVLYHLGMAYSKKGDNTLAKESLSKALKLDQNFPEAKEAKQALDEIGDKRS
jgi:putative PEP-CTERM system TPR-repeat lipoprotein